MSDEELVKRLRDEHLAMTRNEAADRIEALTAERDMATEGWAEATRLIDVARQQYGAEKSRAEALKTKLAKAVEALREALYFLKPTESDMEKKAGIYRIVTTLEEIEGEEG